jgi:hypothetical protein
MMAIKGAGGAKWLRLKRSEHPLMVWHPVFLGNLMLPSDTSQNIFPLNTYNLPWAL